VTRRQKAFTLLSKKKRKLTWPNLVNQVMRSIPVHAGDDAREPDTAAAEVRRMARRMARLPDDWLARTPVAVGRARARARARAAA
jgi:hypothetical protein